MKKKITTGIISAAVAGVLLAGCGGQATNETTTQTTITETTTTEHGANYDYTDFYVGDRTASMMIPATWQASEYSSSSEFITFLTYYATITASDFNTMTIAYMPNTVDEILSEFKKRTDIVSTVKNETVVIDGILSDHVILKVKDDTQGDLTEYHYLIPVGDGVLHLCFYEIFENADHTSHYKTIVENTLNIE